MTNNAILLRGSTIGYAIHKQTYELNDTAIATAWIECRNIIAARYTDTAYILRQSSVINRPIMEQLIRSN